MAAREGALGVGEGHRGGREAMFTSWRLLDNQRRGKTRMARRYHGDKTGNGSISSIMKKAK